MALISNVKIIRRTSSDTLVDQLNTISMAPGRFVLDKVLSDTAVGEGVTREDHDEVARMHTMLLSASVALKELLVRTRLVAQAASVGTNEDNGPSA